MSVTIRQIHIENFRSIQRLTIPADKLSVFVGKNDCGKSNILRALNLFFNGVTTQVTPSISRMTTIYSYLNALKRQRKL